MSTTDDNENRPDDTAETAGTADDAGGESLTAEAELQQLRVDNAELQDRILRSQAELENFRRRTHKEALDAMKYQSLSVIRGMLPGIDNLQRAIAAVEQSGDTQGLVDGIKMVSQQFTDALTANSCEAINPEGQPFDANFHEALSQIPSAEHEPMTVLQVIETGYRIHDRVVRPAKVMVTCLPPDPADEPGGAVDDSQPL